MSKQAPRNPDNYTIGMPQVMFSPKPQNGDTKSWVDYKALTDALMGNTNASGYVINAFGVAVGTPAQIRENCYLGSIDSAQLGGDAEELQHFVSNMGVEEMDRVITLSKPYSYTVGFDEPDVKNLSRFMVGEEPDMGLALRELIVSGVTFQGSGTAVCTIVDRTIGDPARAAVTIKSLWLDQTGLKTPPPNGTYGFIIGGTNEQDCVGAWLNKRQWVAYADFDFAADTVSAWKYLRPKGTAIGGNYGSATLVEINNFLLSIPDSDPVTRNCGGVPQWAATQALAWSGIGWFGSDEGFFGYSVSSSSRSYKRAEGACVIATFTGVGNCLVHSIPRATMVPDGNFDFSMDAWSKGSFKVSVQQDTSAALYDQTPALPVPFGTMRTFRLAPMSD